MKVLISTPCSRTRITIKVQLGKFSLTVYIYIYIYIYIHFEIIFTVTAQCGFKKLISNLVSLFLISFATFKCVCKISTGHIFYLLHNVSKSLALSVYLVYYVLIQVKRQLVLYPCHFYISQVNIKYSLRALSYGYC